MSDLVRQGPIIAALCVRPCPPWVTDGWYSNNSALQAMAMAQWHFPVTTAEERERSFRLVLPPSHACTGCGQFSFPTPKLCYWCSNARRES